MERGQPIAAFLRRRAKRGLKEGRARTRYLTPDEERVILEAASPAVRWAIMLAIDTGLRRKELFSLKWPQVDLLRGLVTTTTLTKSGPHGEALPADEQGLQCDSRVWSGMVEASGFAREVSSLSPPPPFASRTPRHSISAGSSEAKMSSTVSCT
jgi:Phage integrase family